jgi:hypothetical protein
MLLAEGEEDLTSREVLSLITRDSGAAQGGPTRKASGRCSGHRIDGLLELV